MNTGIFYTGATLSSELEASNGNVQIKPLNDLAFLFTIEGCNNYAAHRTYGINHPGAQQNIMIDVMTSETYPFIGADDYYCGEAYLNPAVVPAQASVYDSKIISFGFAFMRTEDWPPDDSYFDNLFSLNKRFFFAIGYFGEDLGYGVAVLVYETGDVEQILVLSGLEAFVATDWYWVNLRATADHLYLTVTMQGGATSSADMAFAGFQDVAAGDMQGLVVHDADTDVGLCVAEIVMNHNSDAIPIPSAHFKIYSQDSQTAVVSLDAGSSGTWDASSIAFANEAGFTSEYIKIRYDASSSATPSFSGVPMTLAAFEAETDPSGQYLHLEFSVTSPDGDTQVILYPGSIDCTVAPGDTADTSIFTATKVNSHAVS